MTKRISDTKPVTEFISIAAEFCSLIENRNEKTDVQLLQETFVALLKLCLHGMRLPDIERLSDYESFEISHEEWDKLFKSLQHKLGDYDEYKQMSDPYEDTDQEPVVSSLSYDMSEIYIDLKPGLQEWENANATERRDIIWQWKWGFENHWGDHAARAFRALYSLLYCHIEDKSGDYLYIGIRDVSKDHDK